MLYLVVDLLACKLYIFRGFQLGWKICPRFHSFWKNMYIHNAYLTSFSERYKVTLSIPFPFGVRWWVDGEGEAFKMPFYTEIQSGSFGFPAIVAVGNAKLWRTRCQFSCGFIPQLHTRNKCILVSFVSVRIKKFNLFLFPFRRLIVFGTEGCV